MRLPIDAMIKRAIVLLALASPVAAQASVASVVYGLSMRRSTFGDRVTLAGPLLELGLSSTIEMNKLVSFGSEARLVQKTVPNLGLWYFETPLFVRFADPRSERWPQFFTRLGIAPAFEVRCSRSTPDNSNTPETRRVTANPGDFAFPPPLRGPAPRSVVRESECLSLRQHKLDVGWLAAIGLSARHYHDEFSVELRVTMGMRNLLANPYQAPVVNRHVALLVSTGTRWF